jgi:sulfite exporter TauE/SafE
MWYTAFMMGIAGSLHCLGMCTPLVVASTGASNPVSVKKLLYNGGRILTYGIQGMVVGTLGSLLHFGGIQQSISMILGIAMVIVGLTGSKVLKVPIVTAWLQRLSLFLKSCFTRYFHSPSLMSTFFLGALNGVLPCGLTYVALASCVSFPVATDGALFMVMFGLGTLPVMLGLTSVFQTVVAALRLNYRLITTGMIVIAGLLLVVRSLPMQELIEHRTITICQ